MAKSKEFEWRMQGMIHALTVVEKNGVDALKAEIKKRGFLKTPLRFTMTQIESFWDQLTENIYWNMLTVMTYTLHNGFGFGEKRLKKAKEIFDSLAKDALDLDWMGNHYVTLEDYAIEMNEKHNLGLNIEKIAACQYAHEKNRNYTGRCEVKRVLEELRAAGYEDAADYLRGKLSV